MNDIEQERLRKVRRWLSYADEDLLFAQHGLKLTTSVPYRLIAYHAQQCVEKCLKAYLVHKVIDFSYTHDISRLLELCAEHAAWTSLSRWLEKRLVMSCGSIKAGRLWKS